MTDKLAVPEKRRAVDEFENEHAKNGPDRPTVFASILLGGARTGALIHDLRRINALAKRGYQCHIFWALDRSYDVKIDPRITQHWLCHCGRFAGASHYLGNTIGRTVGNLTGMLASYVGRTWAQHLVMKYLPGLVRFVLSRTVAAVSRGITKDRPLINGFTRKLQRAGVTHVLPMLGILAPFAQAARDNGADIKYAVTLQGYELYVNLGDAAYRQAALTCIRDTIKGSDYGPITITRWYAERIEREVGIAAFDFSLIHPGVPTDGPIAAAKAWQLVQAELPVETDVPIITYFGRQDSEKGIDLLLYAARILRERGHKIQIVICGPETFGNYRRVCEDIAGHLEIPALFTGFVSSEVRQAVMQCSRCVVYPSIHGEPFGMVPVEAMAVGTPAVVPDDGGVAELVKRGSIRGGLNFRSWDSGDLADQLEKLLTDKTLHAELAANAPEVASHYSISKEVDRMLEHLGITH
jgi:glycosyltransferase involved in cell wall biosynthesis